MWFSVFYLFPDAEAGEDGVEEGGSGDCAGNGAEVVEGLTYVLGYEVATYTIFDAFNSSMKGFGTFFQCFIVPDICYY